MTLKRIIKRITKASPRARQGALVPCSSTKPAAQQQRGAAMVEASLIALPMLMIMYGAVELSIAFSVGASVYEAAGPVANGARAGVGTATIETLETKAKARLLPFAANCIDIDGWEYDTFEDYGADSAPYGDAFVIASETSYTLGDSDRRLGIFDISCQWNFIGNMIRPVMGDSVTFKTTVVVGYEID